MRRLACVIAAMVALVACGDSDSNDAATTTTSTTRVRAANEVGINDNYFDPKVVSGAPGSQVTLKLVSDANALHNFSITSQGIDQDVKPGARASVKVTFPASGDLEFFCKYHKVESGMTGSLRASA